MELKWPVTKCDCGFDLREAEVKASEKSNDTSGNLTWTSFCPGCGRGYNVGARVKPKPPAEALAEMEAAPIISSGEEKEVEKDKGKASGIPPDKRGEALAKEKENPDPEGLLGAEAEAPHEETPEPGAIKPPGKGEFFCTKCASNHKEASKVGKRHSKFREA